MSYDFNENRFTYGDSLGGTVVCPPVLLEKVITNIISPILTDIHLYPQVTHHHTGKGYPPKVPEIEAKIANMKPMKMLTTGCQTEGYNCGIFVLRALNIQFDGGDFVYCTSSFSSSQADQMRKLFRACIEARMLPPSAMFSEEFDRHRRHAQQKFAALAPTARKSFLMIADLVDNIFIGMRKRSMSLDMIVARINKAPQFAKANAVFDEVQLKSVITRINAMRKDTFRFAQDGTDDTIEYIWHYTVREIEALI